MRLDQEAVEVVAHELYETLRQPNDPEWVDLPEDDKFRIDYLAVAVRLVDAYLEKMTRAWAIRFSDGSLSDEIYESAWDAAQDIALYEDSDGARVVPIALVPLPEQKS